MKPVLLCLTLALALSGGCVSERCYENYHCSAPRICGPGGVCVYECSDPGDCGAGFVCEGHVCVAGHGDAVQDSTMPAVYCPAGMVLVQDLFCIDLYEAARPDATGASPGDDGSRAVSREGVYPWLTKDNAVAEAACNAADKRLCVPAEWKLACSGPDDQTYAYGDTYEPATCNGIDTYGRSGFHLMPTGSFDGCVNEFGVFDMNGNVWEHVAGGDGTDVRGGAYNCSDSKAYHKCSYIPGSWTPSALGFRCCRDPIVTVPDKVETVEAVQDVVEPIDAVPGDIVTSDLNETFQLDIPLEDVCGPVDAGYDAVPVDVFPDVPTDVSADIPPSDEGSADAAVPDQGADAVSLECPPDMSLVSHPLRAPFCMDRYEASRSDSTSTSYGTSTVPVSEPGRLPWFSSSLSASSASAACVSAGKRLCLLDEWYGACAGSADTVYVYGDAFDPAVCNSIDTFCACDTTCSTVAACPYPHCRVDPSPAGDGGPCGANFHVVVTGSFPSCVNEWGVFDVNGNVWEVVDAGDSQDHFRGGAYNCSDSEALHRCDHDATWNPSAKGFRCCMDAVPAGGGQ